MRNMNRVISFHNRSILNPPKKQYLVLTVETKLTVHQRINVEHQTSSTKQMLSTM